MKTCCERVEERRQACHRYSCWTLMDFPRCRSSSVPYLHVCSSIVLTQISHFTWQHQWNLQLHRSRTTILLVLYPRPQHRIPQPSRPFEVLLQARPWVPRWERRRERERGQSNTRHMRRSFSWRTSIACYSPGQWSWRLLRHQSGLSSR